MSDSVWTVTLEQAQRVVHRLGAVLRPGAVNRTPAKQSSTPAKDVSRPVVRECVKPRTPEPFGFTRARKDFRAALVMLPERALADSSVVFTRQTLAALRGLRRVDRVQFAATMARLSAIPRFPIMRLRHSLKIAVEARFPNARELIAGYLATAPWVSSGLPGPTPMDVCSVFETQVTLAVRRFAATILRDLGWRPIRMRLGERGEDKRRALVTFYVRGER